MLPFFVQGSCDEVVNEKCCAAGIVSFQDTDEEGILSKVIQAQLGV